MIASSCHVVHAHQWMNSKFIKLNLLKDLESALQSEVTYKQWKKVDRFDLFTVTEPIDLFVWRIW